MKARKLAATVAIFALGLLVSAPAWSYVICGFLDHRFQFRAYYFNSEFWVDMLVAESNKWNRVYPVLSIDRTKSSTIPAGKDGNNVIAWIGEADLNRIYNMSWVGSVGVTITWYDGVVCGRVIEQDMFFNPAISLFKAQTSVPYSLGFQETALHELGHAVTLDHEDKNLSVMTTNNAVSDVLHHNDKVGWNRSASQKFNPLPSPITDMGVFPIRNSAGGKVYSTLNPVSVAAGGTVTIQDFTVENLSNVFPFSNPEYRVVLENTASGASITLGTFFWSNFTPFTGWSGNLTFTVPASTPVATYRVVAIFNGTDDDNTNDRAVFGTLVVR